MVRLNQRKRCMRVAMPSLCRVIDRADPARIVHRLERHGNALVLRPVGRPLDDLMDVFASFAPDSMADGRGLNEQTERGPLA